MIEVLINNQPRKLSAETTVAELLQDLEIKKEGTAIAVNDQVVPRSKHGEHRVLDGDRLEIIRAVGGG